jgi:DNA-binding transcriptional MerR regulator
VELTVDELAGATGTTTRTIRSLQTMGVLDHPTLRGRTGLYGSHHLDRVRDIIHLQARGFSLQSLAILFGAHARGETLSSVLGLGELVGHLAEGPEGDTAELYGFADLQRRRVAGARRPLLSVVPTTMWDQTEAS